MRTWKVFLEGGNFPVTQQDQQQPGYQALEMAREEGNQGQEKHARSQQYFLLITFLAPAREPIGSPSAGSSHRALSAKKKKNQTNKQKPVRTEPHVPASLGLLMFLTLWHAARCSLLYQTARLQVIITVFLRTLRLTYLMELWRTTYCSKTACVTILVGHNTVQYLCFSNPVTRNHSHQV